MIISIAKKLGFVPKPQDATPSAALTPAPTPEKASLDKTSDLVTVTVPGPVTPAASPSQPVLAHHATIEDLEKFIEGLPYEKLTAWLRHSENIPALINKRWASGK